MPSAAIVFSQLVLAAALDRPDVTNLAVDGSGAVMRAELHPHSSQGSAGDHYARDVPEKALHKEASSPVASSLLQAREGAQTNLTRFKSNTCTYFETRQFNYTDVVCGVKLFYIWNLLDAYNVEQGYWAEQGNTNPWWAVLTGMDHGKEPTLEAQLEFYRSGVREVNEMKLLFQNFGLLDPTTVGKGRALDLGCGLGRMSNALASFGFQETICVDQAQSFLDEAQRSLAALAGQGAVLANVTGRVRFVQSAPDLLCAVEPGSVDFVHSVITLQHMKPMLQVAYIEQLCDTLRVGASGYFQMPVKLTNGQSVAAHCELAAEGGGMEMHYTPKSEIIRHLHSRGCRVLMASEKDRIGPIGTSMQFVFDKP